MYFNRSTDGGVSFQTTDLKIGSGYYPSIAADSNNRVYAVWEDWSGSSCFNRSLNGGANFEGAKSPTGGEFCGLPQIAADSNGNIYIARHNFQSIIVDISHDAGVTFNIHKKVSSAGRAVDADIATDGKGNVYVVYGNADGGDSKFYFTRSTDYGVTWTPGVLIGDFGPSIAFWKRPDIAVAGNDVYIAWSKGGNPFNVILRVSHDKGVSFAPEIKVNGSTPQAQVTGTPPTVNVAVENNVVYVTWPTLETPTQSKLWLAVSQNGGLSFDSPVRVDDGTDSNPAQIGQAFGNLIVQESQVFVSWNANISGRWQIRFSRSGSRFDSFTPLAMMTTGTKPLDDTFKVSAAFKLGETTNGIDPVTESVVLKLGNYSITIPPGKFQQDGATYKFEGIINKIPVKAEIRSLSNWPWLDDAGYVFGLKAKNTSLNGLQIVLPPELQLLIGDDVGKAKLGTGEAVFGNFKGGLPWLSK